MTRIPRQRLPILHDTRLSDQEINKRLSIWNYWSKFISDNINCHFINNNVYCTKGENSFNVDLNDVAFFVWQEDKGFYIHNTSLRGSQMVLVDYYRVDRIGVIISHIYQNLDGIRDSCDYCSSGIYPRFSKF